MRAEQQRRERRQARHRESTRIDVRWLRVPGSVTVGAAFLLLVHMAGGAARPAASADLHGSAPPRVTTTGPAPDVAPSLHGRAITPVTSGAVPSSRVVNVVSFGDSVVTSSACHCTPFPALVAQGVAARRGMPAGAVTNWAVDGIGVDGVAQQLTSPEVRASLARADVVTVTIGANDLPLAAPANPECRADSACFRDDLAAERAPLQRTLLTLKSLAPRATVVLTGYWNVYLDGAVAAAQGADYVAEASAMTTDFNRMAVSAAGGAGVRFADVAEAFGRVSRDGDLTALLTPDGDHPNERGHAVIAETVLARVLAER